MKYSFTENVYYYDTDAYGVVWHGAYLRWMEKGRIDFCSSIGLHLDDLLNHDITIPVTNMNIRYKSSATLNETILVETEILKITPVTIVFQQTIKDNATQKVRVIAEVETVAVNNSGKLYRRLPQMLSEKINEAILCNV